jgi:hypothetical protein
MSCALTTGYTLPCRDGVGGLEWIAFAAFSSSDSITVSSGVVTALTLNSGQFYKFEQAAETASVTETETISNQNGTVYYSQEVQMIVNKMTVTERNELRLHAQNRMRIIFKDRNGTYWHVGANVGAFKSNGVATTGTAFADRNGFEQTYTALETLPMYEVDSATISSLGL